MIPTTLRACQLPAQSVWQRELATAIGSPRELIEALGLDPALASKAAASAQPFRMRVPWSYARRMRHGDPNDPLLLQVLPRREERAERAGFGADPLAESLAVAAPGLLHKYHGRALLITTSACAIHCRYCFRREFPYAQHTAAPRWEQAVDRIALDRTIEEVILSGGDPLSLSDARLGVLTRSLERAQHVKRLRIHTRLPVVLPARVDAGLTAWLGALKWRVVIVLHANHPNEIDAEVRAGLRALAGAGAMLLNQSVLLAGVNDSTPVLAQLSERLFEAGVLPYYLHLLDRVRGTAHFAVPLVRARRMAGELAAQLPGYLVPRLVRECAGAPAKVPVAPLLPAWRPAI